MEGTRQRVLWVPAELKLHLVHFSLTVNPNHGSSIFGGPGMVSTVVRVLCQEYITKFQNRTSLNLDLRKIDFNG